MDTCTASPGAQIDTCAYVGGSTLGWGPVGPADWSAKPLLNADIPAPATWVGPILMAGWEFYAEIGLRRCYESIAQKYPPGWAYEASGDLATVLGSDVLARAEVTYDVNRLACLLLEEWVCRTASRTLTDWWADYGLPDDCGIDNLCAKVAAVGGSNCEYFVGLGAMLGHDITCEEIPPEIQCGCWDLGVEQMAPEPIFDGGGSELGFAQIGLCAAAGGAPLGYATLGAGLTNVAGYAVDDDGAAIPDPYGAATCVEWARPASGTLLCGCAAPWSIDRYTGTAYHFRVGLAQPASKPSAAFALMGSWSLGCVSLCTPPREEVLCFIARYRPAHVVPVPVAI